MPKHLIHIGFPKAGSTFLQEWFKHHSQCYFKEGGIAGYHDIYQFIRHTSSDAMKPIQYWVTSAEQLVGAHSEAGFTNTNWGIGQLRLNFSPLEVAKALKALFPQSTILIMTRGFKSRLLSSYTEYLKNGGVETIEKFSGGMELEQLSQLGVLDKSDFIKALLENTVAKKYPHILVSEAWGKITKNQSIETLRASIEKDILHHNYDVIIRHYQKFFGNENVIVLPYELLRDNQTAFLNLLQEKLGLDKETIELGTINPSLDARTLFWYRVFSNQVSKFARLLGEKGYHVIYSKYIQSLHRGTWLGIIRFLSRLFPHKQLDRDTFPDEILLVFKDFALSLKDNPLYKPYAKEYLLEEEQ